jgi:tRNA threonylcarbamoyl adenosine modification protein YeaZ
MILVIDTSSPSAVLATIDDRREELTFNVRETPISMQLPRVVDDVATITKVAVATGPGSFTGLRVGVAFGLGLAIGLEVPIVALPSLELLAARSTEPVTAVIDAGRGRFYYLVPGGSPALGDASEIPSSHALVGHPGTVVPGHRMKRQTDLRSFVEAAEFLLRTAREVPYRKLEIEYMQSFSRKG